MSTTRTARTARKPLPRLPDPAPSRPLPESVHIERLLRRQAPTRRRVLVVGWAEGPDVRAIHGSSEVVHLASPGMPPMRAELDGDGVVWMCRGPSPAKWQRTLWVLGEHDRMTLLGFSDGDIAAISAASEAIDALRELRAVSGEESSTATPTTTPSRTRRVKPTVTPRSKPTEKTTRDAGAVARSVTVVDGPTYSTTVSRCGPVVDASGDERDTDHQLPLRARRGRA